MSTKCDRDDRDMNDNRKDVKRSILFTLPISTAAVPNKPLELGQPHTVDIYDQLTPPSLGDTCVLCGQKKVPLTSTKVSEFDYDADLAVVFVPHMVFSCLAMWCCGCLLGCIGFVLAGTCNIANKITVSLVGTQTTLRNIKYLARTTVTCLPTS